MKNIMIVKEWLKKNKLFMELYQNSIWGYFAVLTMISPYLNTKVRYKQAFGRKLDLEHPETLNDKILWLKFHTYWNNEKVKQCADKLRVRDFVKDCGCESILNTLIGAYSDVDEIPWEDLPEQFALKLNVGCKCNIIVNDKKDLDIEATKKIMKKWLKQKYYLGYSEMQYKGVKPYILVEKYLGQPDGTLPVDYKFYCMNGKSKYVMLCTDREIGKAAKFFYFDEQWNMMPYTRDALDNPNYVVEKPDGIDEAFQYAEKLSKDFPFVRCDLYIINGQVYFGELTFTPSAGLDSGRLKSTDKCLGDLLELPIE